VSLAESGGWLYAVFTDWESAALLVEEIPAQAPLPVAAPQPSLVDKVDVSPPLTGALGENTAGAFAGAVHVLYVDRQREDKRILKWATRADGSRWSIDVLEPPGTPVALLPGEAGPVAFWAADGMLLSASGGKPPWVVEAPFLPAGAATAAGGGFTAYDAASGLLLWLSPGLAGWRLESVPGGRAVHGAALTPTGGLSVVTYVPETHRVILLEQPPPGGRWKSTTVTISEGTRFVYLAPFDGRYIFLYDSMEGARSGDRLANVSLLVPEGRRYSRRILWTGEKPLAGVSALLDGRTVYLLCAGETVQLLRVELR
jgi:hypothetical protein